MPLYPKHKPTLQSQLKQAFAFNPDWQDKIANRSITDTDFLPVFLLFLFGHQQEDLLKVCCDCLIKFLITSPSKNKALENLNKAIDDLYIKIEINTADPAAIQLKKSVKMYVEKTYHKLIQLSSQDENLPMHSQRK